LRHADRGIDPDVEQGTLQGIWPFDPKPAAKAS
jgi:hypothetical protein